MRTVTPAQLLTLADTSHNSMNAYLKRGETALAFGSKQRLAGGVMLDVDAAAMELVDELAAGFGRKIASTIVTAHADTWLLGVGRADATREPIFLIVSEFGESKRHKYFDKRALRDQMKVGVTDIGQQAARFADNPTVRPPDRMVWINLSSILRRIRERGAKIGLDLSAPFFPPEGDENAAKLLALAKKDREAAMAFYAEQKLAQVPA